MLRLSKLTDYAVVILGQFTEQPELKLSATDLAERTGLPAPTVSKILKFLSQAHLVAGQRGSQGGYGLIKKPEEISVADIIAAIEGPIALTDCVTDSTERCGAESFCPMQGNWNRVNQAVRDALQAVKLTEMVSAQRSFMPQGKSPDIAVHASVEA